jgi:hypothetical protein
MGWVAATIVTLPDKSNTHLEPRSFPKNVMSDTGQRGRLVHNEQLNPTKAGFEM